MNESDNEKLDLRDFLFPVGFILMLLGMIVGVLPGTDQPGLDWPDALFGAGVLVMMVVIVYGMMHPRKYP